MESKKIDSRVSIKITDSRYGPHVCEAILDVLEGLGLNRANPFSGYIRAGQTALIKPNWVRESNPLGYDLESLVTHPSLVECLIDLLATAMDRQGTIMIADAPLQKCDFEKLMGLLAINKIVEEAKKKYPNINIVVEDWRITTLKGISSNDRNPQKYRFDDEGASSKEYTIVDVGKGSFLDEVSEYADRFRVTDYKPSLMLHHHAKGKHEYAITNRILEADFIINLPKMKTHMKAGLTCAMKNLIGINGHKEFLPHHVKGAYFEGGDNYLMPNWFRAKYEDLYDYIWEDVNRFSILQRKILQKILMYLLRLSSYFGKENIRGGSWRGNDTIWRTTLDLNHIAYFRSKADSRVLNLVDGIIAGEKQGPLSPTPKPVGVLLAGENPAYIDAVAAKMMGYNISRIPTVYNAVYNRRSKFGGVMLEDLVINYAEQKSSKIIKFDELPNLDFAKPSYWEGA